MSIRKRNSGVQSTGKIWMIGALIVALMPAAALAWTHAGDATIGGKLGVGTENPARGIHMADHNAIFRMDRDRDSAAFMIVRTAPGDFNSYWKSYSLGVRADGADDGYFHISDLGHAVTGEGARRLTLANDGRAGFGNVGDDPQAGLHVRNTVAGDILRLDNVAGTEVLSVEDDGDLYAMGADLELRLTTTTSQGYNLILPSTVLGNTDSTADEAFLALNADTAIICSAGDTGLLRIVDADSYVEWYRFNNQSLYLGSSSDYTIMATNQHVGDDLILQTTGEQIKFVTDVNDDTVNLTLCTWYNNGTATGDRVMDLDSAGSMRLDGTLTQNFAFDLAEAYWKSEAGIEAGDVVSIDPEEPNAVVFSRASNDRTVVGVVSTDPGIVMGGGAFTAEKLTELWGEEIGARFAKERKAIVKNLSQNDPYIKARTAQAAKMKKALPKSGKDAVLAKAACDQEEQELADAVEDAALKAFCAENLARVALAGRVPVTVDAAYGAIRAGDLLVASATAGHAMRSDNPAPGTVVGKALEGFDSGRGSIMMMVLNR